MGDTCEAMKRDDVTEPCGKPATGVAFDGGAYPACDASDLTERTP